MGFLFALAIALVLGTLVSYPLGLGRVGRTTHTLIGVGGLLLGWLLVVLLPVPYVLRLGLAGVRVYPAWGLVGALLIALVIAILRAEEGGSGPEP